MDVDGYLWELFGRLPVLVHAAVEDLDEAKLAEAPADGANTIAWLVWHLTRIEDHHLSEAAGTPQRYIEDGWHERFGRGADPQDHGYGHSPADVASVRATARSEEHTSELQSLMRLSYADFCLKKKTKNNYTP